jgi:hypothetical protein
MTPEEIAAVERECEQLKAYLLAPPNTAFPFQPFYWKFLGRTDVLRFRRVSYPELIERQDRFPQIPPKFTTREWTTEQWEALPEEQKDWWRQPCDMTSEEVTNLRNIKIEILTLTNKEQHDEKFWLEEAGPQVINECFEFVSDISGFSANAMNLIDWFRKREQRAGLGLYNLANDAKATVPTKRRGQSNN